MVGATGFEPATSCSRSRRSTGLSYAPPVTAVPKVLPNDGDWSAPRETRTPNLLIRSQMLYPIELWAPTNDERCQADVQPNFGPTRESIETDSRWRRHWMGGTRLELVTSTMSTWRSNQLS